MFGCELKSDDALVQLLIDTLEEANFDCHYPDGEMYCGSSNSSINVFELAAKIRKLERGNENVHS